MKNGTLSDACIASLLRPEAELEHIILREPEFKTGLLWGKPRFGHPEGKVVYHIKEVLENIDKLSLQPRERSQLRIIAFVHDTFKYLEDKSGHPRDWNKHHGVYAKKFVQKYTEDPTIISITQWHDEAYYSWRLTHLFGNAQAGQARLDQLLNRLEDNLQLYYLFFKCDTKTGDKNQAPLKWFERTVPQIEIVDF